MHIFHNYLTEVGDGPALNRDLDRDVDRDGGRSSLHVRGSGDGPPLNTDLHRGGEVPPPQGTEGRPVTIVT